MSIQDQMRQEQLDWERRMADIERAFFWKQVGVSIGGMAIGSAIVLFTLWFVRTLSP